MTDFSNSNFIYYNSKKIVEKEGLKKLLREKLTRHN